VQLGAHVEQPLVRGQHRRAGGVGALRGGDGLQGVDVAQPAPGALEVRLEQEGDLAVLRARSCPPPAARAAGGRPRSATTRGRR
jgi:hypothetical protein